MEVLDQILVTGNFCGWSVEKRMDGYLVAKDGCTYLRGIVGRQQAIAHLPDYINSLDAMKHAELELGLHKRENEKIRVKWVGNLRLVVGRRCPKNRVGAALCSDIDLLQADAHERLEAFVRTIGKWVKTNA
jgi:hypothetical protein